MATLHTQVASVRNGRRGRPKSPANKPLKRSDAFCPLNASQASAFKKMFFTYWKRIFEISVTLERAKSECALLEEQYQTATVNLDRVTQRAEAAEQRLYETNKMLCAIFSAGLQDDTQTIALEVIVDDRPILLLSNRPVFSSRSMPDRSVN